MKQNEAVLNSREVLQCVKTTRALISVKATRVNSHVGLPQGAALATKGDAMLDHREWLCFANCLGKGYAN